MDDDHGAALQSLMRILPAGTVVHDPDALTAYSRDQAGLVPHGRAMCAVFPDSTMQVAEVVRWAGTHNVPVVTRGAGSGLAGAANAADGSVILMTSRLDKILSIDAQNLTATVQPGVVNEALAQAVAKRGLWYAPDPASRSFSTIGGNVATNAGGLCCIKYGVTGDSVLELEVVLSDGTITRIGRSTVKDVAGYDLVSLFVGSEGTLGVITEVTVRLRPARAPAGTLVATFDNLAEVGEAVTRLIAVAEPSMLEIMDRTTILAVEGLKSMGLPETAALLLAQSDLPADAGAQQLRLMTEICEEAGASYAAMTVDADEADMLLEARRLAHPALERSGRASLLDDVGVPRARIGPFLQAVEQIGERFDLTIGTFGHGGDGNLHPTIVYDPETQLDRARAAFDAIVETALEHGGTITGEHGVGQLKQSWLARQLDTGARQLHRRIKDALDPSGILNPGRASVELDGAP